VDLSSDFGKQVRHIVLIMNLIHLNLEEFLLLLIIKEFQRYMLGVVVFDETLLHLFNVTGIIFINARRFITS
jgi:hypothetical protein